MALQVCDGMIVVTPHSQQSLATILLVDDADMIRELVKTILGDAGYTILQAKDGNECVTI